MIKDNVIKNLETIDLGYLSEDQAKALTIAKSIVRGLEGQWIDPNDSSEEECQAAEGCCGGGCH